MQKVSFVLNHCYIIFKVCLYQYMIFQRLFIPIFDIQSLSTSIHEQITRIIRIKVKPKLSQKSVVCLIETRLISICEFILVGEIQSSLAINASGRNRSSD